MTGEDFTEWMKREKHSVSSAARALGISRTTVMKYKEEGAPEYIGLACAALALGSGAWRSKGWPPKA